MDSESSGHEKENQVQSVHFVSNGPDHSPTILHSQHVCEKGLFQCGGFGSSEN